MSLLVLPAQQVSTVVSLLAITVWLLCKDLIRHESRKVELTVWLAAIRKCEMGADSLYKFLGSLRYITA